MPIGPDWTGLKMLRSCRFPQNIFAETVKVFDRTFMGTQDTEFRGRPGKVGK